MSTGTMVLENERHTLGKLNGVHSVLLWLNTNERWVYISIARKVLGFDTHMELTAEENRIVNRAFKACKVGRSTVSNALLFAVCKKKMSNVMRLIPDATPFV